MPRYKISKNRITEFFGLFGRNSRDKSAVQSLINSDPRLKALDMEIQSLNRKATETLQPWQLELLKRHNISVK